MSSLIIVESSTKAKKIQYFLGKNFKVIASFGHICDLPKNDIGINTQTWQCNYVDTKPDIIKNIKIFIKNSDIIYLASDNDREGHAIAFHISKLIKNKPYFRITFNEITKKAVEKAIETKYDIPLHLVQSQECRRILDRLCGYKLSPLLWNQFNQNTLSCGRVQTVVLGFCIEKYYNLLNYNPNVKWLIQGDFKSDNLQFDNSKHDIYDDKITAINILKSIKWSYKISYTIKDVIENPFPPYMTTSIQIDVYKQLKINSKKCMEILQDLYENGCITYHRTDSLNMSNEFKNIIKNHIINQYGTEYLQIRSYKNKNEHSQEAHECIRITKINDTNETINKSKFHKSIYNLILYRTLASQMSSAIYKHFDYTFYNDTSYQFHTSKQSLYFVGFKILQNFKKQDEKLLIPVGNIVVLSIKCLSLLEKSDSLYDEGTLIKKMEKEGIGRPSTYSNIINNILSRNYVQKSQNPSKSFDLKNYEITSKGLLKESIIKHNSTNNNSKDLLKPTDIGIQIYTFLLDNVAFITNVNFTNEMEKSLDKIASQTITHIDVLNSFYSQIEHILSKITPQTHNDSNIKILNTKYGKAIYIKDEKKYINIEGFYNKDNITDEDISKLRKLPFKLENGDSFLLGKYGFYLKTSNGENKSIKKDFSEKIWNNLL